MKILALISASVSIGLGACATIPTGLPKPPSTDGISIHEITIALQCEMAQAYHDISLAKPELSTVLDDYAAGVKLELKVREENVLGASAKLLIPIVPVKFDSLAIGLGPNLDDTAYRYTTLNFNAAMKDLRGKFIDRQGNPISRCSPEITGFEPATNSLGLGEWIAESVLALGPKDDAADLDNMSYLLEFVLVRDLQGNIAFASNRLQNLSVNGDSKRTRDNTLTVSIARVPSPPKAQHFIIDNEVTVVSKESKLSPDGKRSLPHARPGRLPPQAAASKLQPRSAPPKSGVSAETRQRLEFLNNQQKFNSVISPNSQIIPY